VHADWITANPKYSSGPAPGSLLSLTQKPVTSFMTREQHQETMDLFLKAVRTNHQSNPLFAYHYNVIAVLNDIYLFSSMLTQTYYNQTVSK
jgi:hypothetical protein